MESRAERIIGDPNSIAMGATSSSAPTARHLTRGVFGSGSGSTRVTPCSRSSRTHLYLHPLNGRLFPTICLRVVTASYQITLKCTRCISPVAWVTTSRCVMETVSAPGSIATATAIWRCAIRRANATTPGAGESTVSGAVTTTHLRLALSTRRGPRPRVATTT